MSDPQKPPTPPALPLQLVRPWTPREQALQKQLADLRAALEREQATTAVLRQQYTERTSPQEDTLPGVGASPDSIREFVERRRAREAPGGIRWGLIAGAVIGLAAAVATLRYPGLMGPINDFAKALKDAFAQ